MEAPMPSLSGSVAVFSGGGTGGHLYPALALAEALQELRPEIRIFFVGAQRGLEARVLPEMKVEHLLLPVRGLRRESLLGNLGVVTSLLLSVLQTGDAFSRLRPGMVVVTGGYAGGPAGLAAGLMGIPLVLQEQNAHPGLTTRVLSRWSRQVHLAFPEAREFLPGSARGRARVTGNPVRPPSSHEPGEARTAFGLDPRGRVLLVVGGSQGSLALNQAVLGMVQALAAGRLRRPTDLQLLWATGPAHLEGILQVLAEAEMPPWMRVMGYIDEMPRALRAATLAVSRAGASATSEFLACGLPSVLIPLPTSAADHQARNAESLSRAGAAVQIPQKDLSPTFLWGRVEKILDDPQRLAAMKEAARKRGRPQATRMIAESLARLLPDTLGAGT